MSSSHGDERSGNCSQLLNWISQSQFAGFSKLNYDVIVDKIHDKKMILRKIIVLKVKMRK